MGLSVGRRFFSSSAQVFGRQNNILVIIISRAELINIGPKSWIRCIIYFCFLLTDNNNWNWIILETYLWQNSYNYSAVLTTSNLLQWKLGFRGQIKHLGESFLYLFDILLFIFNISKQQSNLLKICLNLWKTFTECTDNYRSCFWGKVTKNSLNK